MMDRMRSLALDTITHTSAGRRVANVAIQGGPEETSPIKARPDLYEGRFRDGKSGGQSTR